MKREYIPVNEIIPTGNINSEITLDLVLSYLIENQAKYHVYILPQGLICWHYNPAKGAEGCYDKVRSDKCSCPSVDRLGENYYMLCPQYYKRVRTNSETRVQYLCDEDKKGILVSGNFQDGYTASPIHVSRDNLYLKSEDFITVKDYLHNKYSSMNEFKPNIEIHPYLKNKYKNHETRARHQLLWNEAEKIKQSSNKKISLESIAADIANKPEVNITSLKADSIKKSIEKNPNLKKVGI